MDFSYCQYTRRTRGFLQAEKRYFGSRQDACQDRFFRLFQPARRRILDRLRHNQGKEFGVMLYDLLSQDIFEIAARIHPVLTRLLILALAVKIAELLIPA